MRARELMTSPVVTVGPDAPVKEAARLIVTHGFAVLPVVDADDRLLGVVTEADLLRNRLLPDPRELIHDRPPAPVPLAPSGVAGVMTTEVVTAMPDTHAAELGRLMVERHLRAVPVVDRDRLVGIVSRVDVLRTIARDDDAIACDVRGSAYEGSNPFARHPRVTTPDQGKRGRVDNPHSRSRRAREGEGAHSAVAPCDA
jgi:CBS domain-containing protein